MVFLLVIGVLNNENILVRLDSIVFDWGVIWIFKLRMFWLIISFVYEIKELFCFLEEGEFIFVVFNLGNMIY